MSVCEKGKIQQGEEGFKVYKKQILLGTFYFLVYWILIPAFLISLGFFLSSWSFPLAVEVLGKVISAIGFVFAMISAAYMITDGRGAPMSCCPPKKLVKCGTYSMCRHPVYLGYIFYMNGLSLSYGSSYSLVFSLIFSLLIILWALLIEEKTLLRKFPEYEAYKKEVPAFLPKKPEKDDRCPPLFFMFLFFIGHIVSWFTWDIKFEKDERVPEEGYIAVANHTTYLDFAAVIYTLGHFVSFPVSLFHYERNRWLYRSVGSFPIKRHEPDIRAIMKILSYVRKGGRLGIFPEAERSWDGRFLGFKEGFDKLLEKAPKPIVAVRIEKAHLLFPRWARFFKPGRVLVKVKCFDDPKEVEEFFRGSYVDPDDVYPSYKGVENYVYRCPRCGTIGSIKSRKTGFHCKECGFAMEKPTVGDLWKIREENMEALRLPYIDTADLVDPYGRTLKRGIKFLMNEDQIEYDGKVLKREDVKSFLVEGRHEVFFYDGKEMIGFRFKKSALLWNDLYHKFWSSS